MTTRLNDTERAIFVHTLRLMGESVENTVNALTELNTAIKSYPVGTLVLTHGPFAMEDVEQPRTFHNLLAMWWQDKDDGSQFNELLWERGDEIVVANPA